MISTMLLPLMLAASPADEVAVALALLKCQRERQAIVVVVEPEKKAVKYVGSWNMPAYPTGIPGIHKHVCTQCGFQWTHHDSPPPNRIEDHICPHCGALPPGARAVRVGS